MAHLWLLSILVFGQVLPMLHDTLAMSIIEAYKPKRNGKVPTQTSYNKKLDDISSMVKRLEHRIDDAEVRRKIMEAQMRFPLAFNKPNKLRMEAALKVIDPQVPSIIYNNSTIMTINGVLIQIFDDGTVNGTMDYDSLYAKLTLESVGSYGIFRIRGTNSKKYLVFERNGRVVAKSRPGPADRNNVDESLFEIKTLKILKDRKGSKDKEDVKKYEVFDVIRNLKYGWYLGFRRGNNILKIKKGTHVKLRHEESRFTIILG